MIPRPGKVRMVRMKMVPNPQREYINEMLPSVRNCSPTHTLSLCFLVLCAAALAAYASLCSQSLPTIILSFPPFCPLSLSLVPPVFHPLSLITPELSTISSLSFYFFLSHILASGIYFQLKPYSFSLICYKWVLESDSALFYYSPIT